MNWKRKKVEKPKIFLTKTAYEILATDDGRYEFSKITDRSLDTINRWLCPKWQYMFASNLVKDKVLQYTGLTEEQAFSNEKIKHKKHEQSNISHSNI